MAVAESPPPGLEDSGTIRDLRTGVNRVNLNQVVQALQQGRPLPLVWMEQPGARQHAD